MIDVHSAAQALGGEVATGNSVLCPGPGHSAKDRSLHVTFDETGFCVHSFAGDDFATCRDHVASALGLNGRAPRPPVPAPAGQAANFQEAALRIWQEARDPRGTLAETYLALRVLPLDEHMCGRVLRFHPRLRYRDGHAPGMVALFRDIKTNRPTGIHRIFLDAAGGKLERKMLGHCKGSAVKLDAAADVADRLVIAEGIETAMAGRRYGKRPAWALGSVSAIREFPLLAGVETLMILAEHDPSSENAVQVCAARWRTQAAVGILRSKDRRHNDINDMLMEDPRARH